MASKWIKRKNGEHDKTNERFCSCSKEKEKAEPKHATFTYVNRYERRVQGIDPMFICLV